MSKWFTALANEGEIYEVGGAVRDELIGGLVSKDLDLLVRTIPWTRIIEILKPFGKVNEVGKSFGVIKFTPEGESEEVDIAIPRTDRKVYEGHQGFDIFTDPEMPLVDDLARRDFTINAIAKGVDGNLVDPYNGVDDVKRKLIRAVSEVAFSEDPLRMLRAVQFASRFKGFKIEPKTMKLIQKNKKRISEISTERVVIEFEKIVTKGNVVKAARLLRETGLYTELYRTSMRDFGQFTKVKTLAEFLFLLSKRGRFEPDFVISGDVYDEIQALKVANNKTYTKKTEARRIASAALAIYDIRSSEVIKSAYVRKAMTELGSKYPVSVRDLEINGKDLMELGFRGVDIGIAQRRALFAIYQDKVMNNKNDLFDFLK